MLSSPLEHRLGNTSEDQFLASGNTAYLQSQLVVERQRQKITEMENQIRMLEIELVVWKTRFTSAQYVLLSISFPATASSDTINRETLDKLIQNVSTIGLSPTNATLSTHKDMPPPLDPKNFPQVRFWTAKSFEEYCNNSVGETNALATQQRKRGRCGKSEGNDDRHPYLENEDGSAIPRETLVKVGQRARRLWQALVTAGLAPSSWGKASENAYTYFNNEMLNEPELQFFRYCEGNWKLLRWAARAYSSWTRNHLKSSDADNSKTQRANKRKREPLDDPSLLQIDNDNRDDIVITSESGPIEDHSNTFASPSLPVPVSHPIQVVCSHQLWMRCSEVHY
jgi:hypothetical protein